MLSVARWTTELQTITPHRLCTKDLWQHWRIHLASLKPLNMTRRSSFTSGECFCWSWWKFLVLVIYLFIYCTYLPLFRAWYIHDKNPPTQAGRFACLRDHCSSATSHICSMLSEQGLQHLRRQIISTHQPSIWTWVSCVWSEHANHPVCKESGWLSAQ